MFGEAVALALAASAAWGVGMTAAAPALRYVDRLTYLVARWGLVALFALAYAALARRLFIPAVEPALWAALAGVVDATAGGFFYVLALERSSTYQATALSNTAPLWGVFGAVFFLGEPLAWSVAVAAALAIVGAWFLVGKSPKDSACVRAKALGVGTLSALAAGVFWGVAETVPAKLALEQGLPAETLLFLFATAGCLGAAALLPLLRPRIPVHVDPRGFPYIALSGLAGAGVGWLLWLFSLARAPASVVAPVRGATLFFCLVCSVLFLRERPSPRALLGVACVAGSVLLVSFRL